MSRDFSPADRQDLRKEGPASRTDARQEARSIPQRNTVQEPSPNRARDPLSPDPPYYEGARLWRGRERDYWVSRHQEYALADIGRFRAIATKDLSAHFYVGHREERDRDLSSLKRQGLVQSRTFEGPDGNPREILALTMSGYRLLRQARTLPEEQAAYYGLVKPKEANHDADIYRIYGQESARISREGGTKLRVMLDFELKRRINRDFGTFGTESRDQIALRHGLQVVNSKIPIPDLRIEYETRDGHLGRVDLEVASEHYRPRQLQEKVQAGFSVYAPRSEADRLRRILDQRELTAEILTI